MTRSSRNMKRPHYNEDSENEDGGIGRRSKRRHVSPQIQENDENDSSDNEEEALVSVSSRGRLRKISAKARGLFKE